MIGYLNKRLVHVNAWQSCAGAMRQVTRAILLHVRREFDSGYVFLIFGYFGDENRQAEPDNAGLCHSLRCR